MRHNEYKRSLKDRPAASFKSGSGKAGSFARTGWRGERGDRPSGPRGDRLKSRAVPPAAESAAVEASLQGALLRLDPAVGRVGVISYRGCGWPSSTLPCALATPSLFELLADLAEYTPDLAEYLADSCGEKSSVSARGESGSPPKVRPG